MSDNKLAPKSPLFQKVPSHPDDSEHIQGLISYEGTAYLGWQKTKEGPSIEQTVSDTLSQLLRRPTEIEGASRTDRGVHARGQVCSFFAPRKTNLRKLSYQMNCCLPQDIVMFDLKQTSLTFHPSLDATKKTYRYFICNDTTQLPFFTPFSWHVPKQLNLEQMQHASSFLKGTHSFEAFTGRRETNCTRTIFDIVIAPLPFSRLYIEVSAPTFLYHMVRIIVGTLVDVGLQKINPEEIPRILQSKERSRAGVTAPPHGLCLEKIFYL